MVHYPAEIPLRVGHQYRHNEITTILQCKDTSAQYHEENKCACNLSPHHVVFSICEEAKKTRARKKRSIFLDLSTTNQSFKYRHEDNACFKSLLHFTNLHQAPTSNTKTDRFQYKTDLNRTRSPALTPDTYSWSSRRQTRMLAFSIPSSKPSFRKNRNMQIMEITPTRFPACTS